VRRLAELRPVYIVVACAVWIAFVILLPRLMLLAIVLYFRLQALVSPARNHGGAFGGAHWASWQAMAAAAAVPPVLLLGAWTLSRLVHRGAAP
jgi:hypothetical protein